MDNCIFCKIVSGEIPSTKVYEDERILAFKDLNPEAPVHVLVIPKVHISSLNEIDDEHQEMVGYIFGQFGKIAEDLGIAKDGYRVVSNCGVQGGQTVGHIHFHVLGGRQMQWPPG